MIRAAVVVGLAACGGTGNLNHPSGDVDALTRDSGGMSVPHWYELGPSFVVRAERHAEAKAPCIGAHDDPEHSCWALRVEVTVDKRGELVIYYPATGSAPPAIRQPRVLSSGAIEGVAALDDGRPGVSFGTRGGVLMVARGTAIELVRTRVLASADPPAPPPIPDGVPEWELTVAPQTVAPRMLKWTRANGRRCEWFQYTSTEIAEKLLAFGQTGAAVLGGAKDTEAARRGNEVVDCMPPADSSHWP